MCIQVPTFGLRPTVFFFSGERWRCILNYRQYAKGPMVPTLWVLAVLRGPVLRIIALRIPLVSRGVPHGGYMLPVLWDSLG